MIPCETCGLGVPMGLLMKCNSRFVGMLNYTFRSRQSRKVSMMPSNTT